MNWISLVLLLLLFGAYATEVYFRYKNVKRESLEHKRRLDNLDKQYQALCEMEQAAKAIRDNYTFEDVIEDDKT